MAKYNKIRYQGAIPERQHDAFLLALLLAVSLNIAVVAVQAVLPRLASLLQWLGPEKIEQVEEESYPFQLIDPSFLDEQLDESMPVEAESSINREARQTEEVTELPEERAYIPEGVDEILSSISGNPGPELDYARSPGDTGEQPAEPAEQVPPVTEPAPPEEQAPDEPITEEIVEPREPPPPQPEPEPPPPEPVPEPPPLPEIEDIPPETPLPEVEPEPVPEPEPDPIEPLPEPIETEPEPQPESAAEIIDIASLPMTVDGFFDPETRRLEELARPVPPAPPRPSERPQPTEPVQEMPPPPTTQPRQRTGRQPTFRRIGGDSPSSAAASGGSPQRRNRSTSVNILDSDASMRLLAHRYGEYMAKVARQLQESLNRVMALTSLSLARGQVKIRFGISPDGSLTYQETIFPEEGEMVSERLISEQMLREAGPFDPLTPRMQEDPNFQRMTVVVNLY